MAFQRKKTVDEAFAALTTNLTANLSGLEAGQEEILTGQEGLFGGQQDILAGVGEESQTKTSLCLALACLRRLVRAVLEAHLLRQTTAI